MAGNVLDAGQLTAKLLLQAPIDTGDGQGGVVRSWEDRAELWAAIRPLSHSHSEVASATSVSAFYDIWLNMRRDIQAGMRLTKGARIFTIVTGRDADEMGRFLILRCREEL